jgi:hypothetical protein
VVASFILKPSQFFAVGFLTSSFSVFTGLITEVSSAERGHEGGSVGAASILCKRSVGLWPLWQSEYAAWWGCYRGGPSLVVGLRLDI